MHALEISNLKKTYANGRQALKGVSFNVNEGDFFALLGPNGAGKSTLINIVTNLCSKTDGRVKIFGHDVDKELNAAKACLGVVPQEFNFNPYDSVLDVVLNQAGYYGIPKSKALPIALQRLEQLGLKSHMNNVVMSLSGGMKRRVMIARALIHQPKLLILDEPTAGVDIELRRSLWEFLAMINQQGTTIILTTHYLEEAENLCRNIAIIHHGVILKHTSMSSLLKTLDQETFVFYSVAAIEKLPSMPSEWHVMPIDPHTFEVTVRQPYNLNDVFEEFKKHQLEVSSMRNKTNRLEALFIDLVTQAK